MRGRLFICVIRFPTTAELDKVRPRSVFVGDKLPNALKNLRMAKSKKKLGRVYTPKFIVDLMLDFGGYRSDTILRKNVIDNSCGDGAFLVEIVRRYCNEFLITSDDLIQLKTELQTFIHGIEIDGKECFHCVQNLNKIAEEFGLYNVAWDVLNADTLTVDAYNGNMDYVFGNPPYVRVHNLEESYEGVKKYGFAKEGMTDLFIVFFEIGFRMLNSTGLMCLITPSSWLNSIAGNNLREYIFLNRNLSGVIDLGHFQPFDAMTYTLISRFKNGQRLEGFEYYNFDEKILDKNFQENLPFDFIKIGNGIFLSKRENLELLRKIKVSNLPSYVSVKNGFATLADKVFIGDFDFHEGTIPILKASTGMWSRCIYPYDKNGNPLSCEEFAKSKEAFSHLLSMKDRLPKSRDNRNAEYWYLYGRSQALKDVSKNKYAINTIVKDKGSIRLEVVPEGCGVYSGLYILTDMKFEFVEKLICSDDFIEYVKLLKNYKSGGYYTFSSKDLEHYLNYKIAEIYG